MFAFGAVADYSNKAHNDIDLTMIGTVSLRQLSKRLSGLETKPGREVNLHVLTREKFAWRTGKHNFEHMGTCSARRCRYVGRGTRRSNLRSLP